MKNLQGDPAPLRMHRIGDLPMPPSRPPARERGGEWLELTRKVGGDAAGDDEAHTAPRAGGEVGSVLFETSLFLFEPNMHGPHQHSVLEGDVAEVKGLKKMGVGCSHAPDVAQSCPRIDRHLTAPPVSP